MRPFGLPQAIAWCAFFTVCMGPFLFGAVERSVWIPLCQLWIGLGLASTWAGSRGGPGDRPSSGLAVSRALLPLHALFALQLIPMPAFLLRVLSPASFAAHFLPDPGDGRFRPLTVSPGSTVEAWLYVAGLQGLFLALQGIPVEKRRAFLGAMVAVILILAGEGLWQSRSPHPFWFYGRVPTYSPQGLEEGIFGPYYNRNHFATVVAMGAGLAAGLAASITRERGGFARMLSDAVRVPKVVLLAGAAAMLVVSSAASGSRSGALAAVAAMTLIAARSFGTRLLLVGFGVGALFLAISGAAAIERLSRLDVTASRWQPWMDMTGLVRFFPVFGSGAGTFAVAYFPHQTFSTYEFWRYAHNDYLQWVIEGGLLGVLALFVALRSLRRSVHWDADAGEGGLGAAFAFGTQALFDFPCRIPANAGILVGILALTVALRPRSRN